jgi:type IV secretion system protein VirB7
MKPTASCLLLALLLAGCASTGATSLPVCDGKHLRPANPNGSVLDPKPTAAETPTAPATAPTAATQPGCGQ